MTKYKSNQNQFISMELLNKVLNLERLHFPKKKCHDPLKIENMTKLDRNFIKDTSLLNKNLSNLEELYSSGFILFEEYLIRKEELLQSVS